VENGNRGNIKDPLIFFVILFNKLMLYFCCGFGGASEIL
jgi:hypothetical protein